MTYLAIDPGEHNRPGGSTGWATFDDLGEIITFGQIQNHKITSFVDEKLKKGDVKAVICEDYINFTGKRYAAARNWSKNKTSVAIGRVEAICELHNVPLHKQPSSILPIGYKYLGIEPPSNHDISHQFSAAAHGTYWLHQNGILKVGANIPEELL